MQNIELRLDAVAGWIVVVDLVVAIILAAALLEIIWDLVTRYKKTLWETSANILIGIGNIILEKSAYGLVFLIGLLLTEPFALIDLPINTITWIIAIILADLSYYWMHRLEHQIRFLWTLHSVHHSSVEFDLTTGLRLSWLEGLLEWIFFVPLVLIGFDAIQVLVSIITVVAYQTWIHTEKIGKLGWVDKVLNTPSVHRVHHGSNRQYIDKNYGGILIIWDRLFGSYEPEHEKVVYGLRKNIQTSNPFKINFYEIYTLFLDCKQARSARECWQFLVRRPGWKPEKTPDRWEQQ